MAEVSIFDVFEIGIGPSSSHTVGPMKAARAFVQQLEDAGRLVDSIRVTLYGSLAYTGKGHATDSAILLGLMGLQADTIDPDAVAGLLRAIERDRSLDALNVGRIAFDPDTDFSFEFGEELPRHTNGMRFVACSASGETLADDKYYSLGGGFIARNDEPETTQQQGEPPFPFDSGESLLGLADGNKLSIAEFVYHAAVLGGSNYHIEEAAEIGMEHNLGLTCGGLVQIPCIERNAMGAVKAINAATLAMHGDGTHKVTLDQVIETMRQTGLDMSSHYKETSQGSLAVNVPEC